MARSLRLWCLALALLLWTPHARCREVTHEDIRDAMLSLVHMFRTSEDKLERHEYREKALGEQLKKMLNGLERRHRVLEPLKGMISRLDERLSNVETILFQKEEREKKTNSALEDIQKSLQTLTATLTPSTSGDNVSKTDDTLGKRLDGTDLKIDAVKQEIESLKNSLSKDALRSMCLEAAMDDGHPFTKHISEAEKLLNKYELKLNEYNESRVQTDFVPLSEVSLADEAWHSKMSEVMERQEKDIKKIQQLLGDAESMWKDLPRRADLQLSTNQTLEAVVGAKDSLKESDEQSVNKLSTKLREMSESLATTNQDIQQSLTQGNTMSEQAFNDISRGYETLKNELQALLLSEQALIQSTADNVTSTKKRVEYGVHQIKMEVGELIKREGKHLNKSVNERFDNIEATISSKQSATLSNISSKIESEMSQVWRQIGTMYQQLTANKLSLDKLTAQTEQYVNSSSAKMDGMKDKVTTITSQIVKIEENLNHLVGSQSMVNQEFSQIKTSLGAALDKAKLLGEKPDKPKEEDAGPGPHKISSAEEPSIPNNITS